MSLPTNFFIGRGAADPLKDLPGESGRLFVTTSDAVFELNTSNFTGSVLSTSSQGTDANFPAQMIDTMYDSNGVGWIITHRGGEIQACKLNDRTNVVATYRGVNSRALGVLRNGILLVATDSSQQIRSYTLNTNGTFTHVATYQDSSVTSAQCIISPPNFSSSNLYDGSNLGDYTGSSCIAVVCGNQYAKKLIVSSTGEFTASSERYVGSPSQATYFPNGYILLVNNGGDVEVLNQLMTRVQQGQSGLGEPGSITMGADGRPYIGFSNYRLSKMGSGTANSFSNESDSFTGDTATAPDYPTGMVAMGDYLYYTGYQNSTSWGYVKRHPLNTSLAYGNLDQSTNYQNNYSLGLTTGRPHWANVDENFLVGSGW